MKLLTKELRRKLPKLGSTEHEEDPVAIVKYFTPFGNYTWYATEFDGEDTFFGLVDGYVSELGYFSLSTFEAASARIERDLWFKPTPLSALR
tara:strand:+ start:163 stop:438 length:276 start_codon:yes stop_codon:yes gene_type:complete